MKIHRFYIPSGGINFEHKIWISDKLLIHQWLNVLRFKPGQKVVLFDGVKHDRLYNITEIGRTEVALEMVTDMERKLPKHDVYLLWSLLKKDKNDLVLQKCTELGVSHFVPLLADRCEKTGFNIDRAKKIVFEAAEQCGRSDIPSVREPINIDTAITELKDKTRLYICEAGGEDKIKQSDSYGVFIGPEGGWSDGEKALFKKQEIKLLNLHDFTLRAETAAVSAATKLIQ